MTVFSWNAWYAENHDEAMRRYPRPGAFGAKMAPAGLVCECGDPAFYLLLGHPKCIACFGELAFNYLPPLNRQLPFGPPDVVVLVSVQYHGRWNEHRE